MMEIKFRGQDTRNGKWVYGGIDTDWGLPHEQRERYWIIGPYYSAVFVNPETVGQFTGLHDKNGKEIYEGDILLHEDTNWGYGGEYDKTHDGYLRTAVPNLNELIKNDSFDYDGWQFENWEVIGNIYENPELEV